MPYPWGTERRFNAYSDYFRKHFGERVQKISIHAGFSCPNRDGSNGRGGCTFCDNSAFTPAYNDPATPVGEQLQHGMAFHRKRYRKARQFLAYFQSYTNTYAPLERLKRLYEEALSVPGVIGIVIGTRPDCVDPVMLDYLARLSQQCYLVVEYGIESIHDKSLLRVNRGHDVETARQAVTETSARGIRTGAHLIVGLPGEGPGEVLETVKGLSDWPLHSIKFHQLQLIRGTAMAEEFAEVPGDFMQFSLDAYLGLMVDVIEHLAPSVVVERIAGEVSPAKALQQGWGLRYDAVLKRFEGLLEEKDTFQGKCFNSHRI